MALFGDSRCCDWHRITVVLADSALPINVESKSRKFGLEDSLPLSKCESENLETHDTTIDA